MNIKNKFLDFIHLIYPQVCIGCNSPLMDTEEVVCLNCLLQLPKTNYFLHPDNPAYLRLAIRIPIQKATAFLYYNKEGLGQKIIARIKYKDDLVAGEWIGKLIAKEILPSGFFQDIDLIIPIPLHQSKRAARGFNQSEIIARSLSNISGIPLDTYSLYKEKANTSQTTKNVYERWINTLDMFSLREDHGLSDKHILLIDDVLTTGATIEAASSALHKCPTIKVSVLTVAIA